MLKGKNPRIVHIVYFATCVVAFLSGVLREHGKINDALSLVNLYFVAATCRRSRRSHRKRCFYSFCRCDQLHEFKPIWIRAADRRDKDFHKNSPCQTRRIVAATCRLVCPYLYCRYVIPLRTALKIQIIMSGVLNNGFLVVSHNIEHWTKLFWIDVLLQKHKTIEFIILMITKFHTWKIIFMYVTQKNLRYSTLDCSENAGRVLYSDIEVLLCEKLYLFLWIFSYKFNKKA